MRYPTTCNSCFVADTYDRYGISIIGNSFSETTLLRIGVVLENLTRTRDAGDSRRLQQFR